MCHCPFVQMLVTAVVRGVSVGCQYNMVPKVLSFPFRILEANDIRILFLYCKVFLLRFLSMSTAFEDLTQLAKRLL